MNGLVVVITGSTRGIGRALAEACAKRGAKVVVHGRHDVARTSETIEGAVGIAADLSTAEGAARLITGALAACGRIDVLVNNAAVSPPRVPFWETDPAALTEAIATNITAPMLCSRALLAHAVPRGEAVRIVNVSSGIAALPREGAAAYTATKAALDGFTRALALDAGSNVTVTAVALGGFKTELAKQMLGPDELATLPDAAAAVGVLLHAISAPADHLHGRVLGAREAVLDTSAIDLLAHPIGPSPRAREALAAVAKDGALDRYPDRDHAELRKLLAAHHDIPLDSIVLGGGISQLLDRVLRLATRPGEAVIANAPSWPVWEHACRTHGLSWRRAPYRLVDGRADHDLDAIARSIDRSVHVVYLTSPGNPGGRALDAEPFQRFLAGLPQHVTVIVDEAYADFATRPDALRAARCVQWTDQLIVLRSFSKLHGLAGLRIGYAIASRDRARVIERAAPAFPLVRGAGEAAVAALSDHAHVRRVITEVTARRSRLEQALDRRGIARLASDAPFVLAADPAASGPRFFDRYVMLPAWAEIE